MTNFLTYKIAGIEGQFRIPIEQDDDFDTITSLIKNDFSILTDLSASINGVHLQGTEIISQFVHNEDIVTFLPTKPQNQLTMSQQIIIRPRYQSNKTFIVFSTINYESMTIGDKIQINITKATKKSIQRQIINLLSEKYKHELHQNRCEINNILLYLPGGIPYYDDAKIDKFIQSFPDFMPHLYSIVLYEDLSDTILNKKIENVCSINDESIRFLFSPYFKSETKGLSEIAVALGYIQNNGKNAKSMIYSIAKFCPFAPLINGLFGLTSNVIIGQTIVQITAPLSVLFVEMSRFLTDKTNLFSSTFKFLTYFMNIKISDIMPCTIFTRPFNDIGHEKFFHCTIEESRQIEKVIAFNPDIENQDWIRFKMPSLTNSYFESAMTKTLELSNKMAKNLLRNDEIAVFKNKKRVYLFLKENNNNVEYINPEVGTIETENIIKLIYNDDNDNVFVKDEYHLNEIELENVTQLVFFCICKSKSMDKHFDYNINRFQASFCFVDEFVLRCYNWIITSLFGSITFNSNVDVRSKLEAIPNDFINRAVNKDDKPVGGRAIFKAVKAAAENIISVSREKEVLQNAVPRIILLCDGDDNSSNPSEMATITNLLLQNKIIVDSFFFSSKNISKEVVALSHFTGGISTCVNNFKDINVFFKNDEFVDVRLREFGQISKPNLTSENFTSLTPVDSQNLDKEMKIKESEFIDSDEPVIVPSIEYLDSIINDPNILPQTIYIIEQLKLILEEPSQDIRIYPLKERFDVWRILIKGSEDSPYKGKWFCMIYEFNNDPKIRFLSLPFHPNINNIDIYYNKNCQSVKQTIDEIRQTLNNPNFDHPIDSKRKGMKIEDDRYLQLVNEWNQKNGRNSPNEWIEEWNIKHPIIQKNPYVFHQPIYVTISIDEVSNTKNFLKQFKVLETDLIDQLLCKKVLIGKGATSIVYKVSNCFTHKGFLCLKVLNSELFNQLNKENSNKTKNKSIWDDDDEEEDNDEKNDDDDDENPQINLEQAFQLCSEYEILNNLNHPNIIKVFGFFFGDKNHSTSILLEYCKFNLEEVIKELEDVDLVGIIYEICSAMKYVHERNIIHRDLKMKNILINSKKHVKICDFGIAKEIDLTTYTTNTHGIGTIAFMAPEIFNEELEYNEKVDVYSFAVVMYFIFTKGNLPHFAGTGKYETVKLPKTINKLSRSIIKKCWSSSPENRPSFKDLLELIVDKNFLLIDGIEDKIPQLLKHLELKQ